MRVVAAQFVSAGERLWTGSVKDARRLLLTVPVRNPAAAVKTVNQSFAPSI